VSFSLSPCRPATLPPLCDQIPRVLGMTPKGCGRADSRQHLRGPGTRDVEADSIQSQRPCTVGSLEIVMPSECLCLPVSVGISSDRFDRLARSLSAASTRRTLVRLLATVPIAGGLLSLLTPADVLAGKRGKDGKSGKGGKDRKTHGRTGKERSGTSRLVGFCDPDISDGDLTECDARCPGEGSGMRVCVNEPGPISCRCIGTWCDFDGPPSGVSTSCCSCAVP
jgi:hypothetical protein